MRRIFSRGRHRGGTEHPPDRSTSPTGRSARHFRSFFPPLAPRSRVQTRILSSRKLNSSPRLEFPRKLAPHSGESSYRDLGYRCLATRWMAHRTLCRLAPRQSRAWCPTRQRALQGDKPNSTRKFCHPRGAYPRRDDGIAQLQPPHFSMSHLRAANPPPCPTHALQNLICLPAPALFKNFNFQGPSGP